MIASLLGLLMLLAAVCGFVFIIWAGLTRCRKCNGWCVDTNDCAERQFEQQRK
jgi:hypothetical protein